MAHLLVLELPGGNDVDVLQAALARGDRFTFLTQNLSVYETRPEVWSWVQQAAHVVESPGFAYDDIERHIADIHRRDPLHALLCLIDIRLVEAAKLAAFLQLRFLNPASAQLLRDKFSVRQVLRDKHIAQPEFHLATTNEEVLQAVQALGLPVLIKPSDGYGSQNILTLQTPEDLELAPLGHLLPIQSDYGLGVVSNDRLLVERYMPGILIGCDTFSDQGKHQLLGINEKRMFPPPSFAIQGGCFVPFQPEWKELESYVFSLLDAVGFDVGATHIEIMVTAEGPRLVEINPRLVGAKIPRLISHGLKRSIHDALIDLHLGHGLMDAGFKPSAAVTRWITSDQAGILARVELPSWQDDRVKCVEVLKAPGDSVSYPFENAHRIGYVMTCADSKEIAEQVAEDFIRDTRVVLKT